MSFLRALGLAAALRGDFLCVARFEAARVAGFLDFVLAMLLSLSCRCEEDSTSDLL
jgi:hypothetical protein